MNQLFKIMSSVSFLFFIGTLTVICQPYGRKKVDRTPLILKEPGKNDSSDLDDIVDNEETFFYELILKNYNVGLISHLNKEIFIQRIITKIQEIRTNKSITQIEITGWADGTENKGISKFKLKIQTNCLEYTRELIYDKELALLRACEIQTSLNIGIQSHSIELSSTIDSHDERDNENIGGEYRKVVVKISY